MIPAEFLQLFALMLGGGTGACLRYACGLTLSHRTTFPYATLLVNAVGSGCAGLMLAATLAAPASPLDAFWRVPIADGLLGGLTTFSTFALETFTLLVRHAWVKAVLNTMANAGIGLVAALGGYALWGGL